MPSLPATNNDLLMEKLASKPKHLLTILVEDYFHVGAFENLIQQRNWSNFEPRYEQNTLKALDLLDEYGTTATFFVLGWIAEQNPGLVREIVSRGHEVASRGYYHRSLKNLTNDEFREDLRRTNRAIEDAGGRKVLGYRAAEKLSFENNEWVFEVLAEEGFAYDASFVPNTKTAKPKRIAHQVHAGGKAIWEFPFSTRDLGLGLLPISGGNYFRQIPYTLMRHAVRNWHIQNEAPFVSYFHVWELDPEQPRISAASKYNRIRHYRKLDKMEWIIRENLELYDCVGVAEHLGLAEEIKLNKAASVETDRRRTSRSAPSTTNTPVSIVIPCYNEHEALPYLSNTLRAVEAHLVENGYEPKLIFVDDKSKDDTFDLLQELFGQKDNVQILQHDVNRGVAAGIMTGINAAETEIVCSMDCDCTYDPHELLNMLPLMKGSVDLVTASPYHKDGGVRNVPGWRLFLSRGASFLYRRVLRSKLDTYTSCFRVYRRSSMLGLPLREYGFLGVAEMLGRLDLNGGRIVEFPAILEVRLFGISKMKTAHTILGHLKLLSQLTKMRWFRKSDAIKPSLGKEKLKIVSENSSE
jgi:polysaccharide deacetylase family protein (PEP-CTERM system associated)